MILHRVVASNVGAFAGPPGTAGPFTPGLNLLCAPNETGKTTLLKATGRALFDRHTCKADEIRVLRPAGTSLAPAMTVEFEAGSGRFRIEKTFLQNPRSLLSGWTGDRWQPLADGDAADDRLSALLQTSRSGRGATSVAHWGMLGYLWMRQGEQAEWPDWQETPAGQVVQGMLVKVEIDPFIEMVRQRMWGAFTENFTPATNQPKVGGTLLQAEQELARVEAELAATAETRHQIQSDQEAFDRLSEELPRLEAESEECRRVADTLRETAGHAAVLKVETERCRHAVETARDRLKTLQNDADAVRRHGQESERIATALRAAQEETARCVREVVGAGERLRVAEAAQEENARALAAAQADLQRLDKLARGRRLAEAIERGTRVLERCAAQAAVVEALGSERAELPSLPPAKLSRLEKLQDAIRANRAKVEALGLTVELTPANLAAVTIRADGGAPAALPDIPAGATRTIHAAQTLVLELPGWGTLRLRSGAGEARTLRDTLTADEETLRQELASLGVQTPEDVRLLAERARELDTRLEAARKVLAEVTGGKEESPAALRTRRAENSRQLEALSGELAPTPEEQNATAADLDAAEQAANVGGEHLRSEGKALERRLKEHRESAAQAVQTQERAERAILSLRLEGENLQRQADALQTRYTGGLEAAIQKAGEDFAEASYALKQAQAKLPPEAETLPERNRRAATAAEQVNVVLRSRRAALATLQGRLELLGSSGLHERESALLARQAAHQAQVTQARARSRAARLVHDLIERRKLAATRAVLAPLQERLSARFAEVSGERERRIFLDESLTVRGLGRKDGELVNFEDLSQGAKEQLLLCLRLAIAEELAAKGEGPQCLILDDVLVNTDVARQRRVLDLLNQAAAGGLQILVCTCHPDRYRGGGVVVELRRGD